MNTSELTMITRFRWVQLQLEYLCTLNRPSAVINRLGNLPKKLVQIYRDLYDSNIERQDAQDRLITWHVFSWLLVAQTQLHSAEIISLLSLADETACDLTIGCVLDLCFNLVYYDAALDVFRFTHSSVREFLEQDLNEYSASSTHSMATTSCLDILERKGQGVGDLNGYAGLFWASHAAFISDQTSDMRIRTRLEAFLRPDAAAFCCWGKCMSVLVESETTLYGEERVFDKLRDSLAEPPHPLLAACVWGLKREVQSITSGLDEFTVAKIVNKRGENGLCLAAYHGHYELVAQLVQAWPRVAHAPDGLWVNALQAASSVGNEKVVQTLLDTGLDVNAQGGRYGNALQAASRYGYKAVVLVLLDKDADVNARGGYYDNALQAASIGGHDSIVQILLERGADVNAQGGFFGSALQAASPPGHEKIVRALLERGADVNFQGGNYGSALQAASAGGCESIVRALLERGADVNSQGGCFGTAIRAAAKFQEKAVMHILLEHGAVLNDEEL